MSTSVELSPDLLISAYVQGIFPMADDSGEIYWYDPNPRTIIPLDAFHISRRLARTIRQGLFEIRVNTDFAGVMRGCADREPTWINEEIIRVYTALHQMGFAHSVECWRAERLVGGIYGVAIRGLFAGESMFSYETDASKVALVFLLEHVRDRGFELFDVQFTTSHLLRFGALEIPRREYRRRLARALQADVTFV